ncbi:MAG: hypothetical protein ACQET7_07615 [Thermodesulfobacteriota bacterium]
MSTIGWTQSVNASSVLDKIQQTQQAQEELSQVQAKAKALQEERLRRTTVNSTPDTEKIRVRDEKDRRREERRNKRQKLAAEDKPGEDEVFHEEDEQGRRKIDIKV